jgi:hypothetical protein
MSVRSAIPLLGDMSIVHFCMTDFSALRTITVHDAKSSQFSRQAFAQTQDPACTFDRFREILDAARNLRPRLPQRQPL